MLKGRKSYESQGQREADLRELQDRAPQWAINCDLLQSAPQATSGVRRMPRILGVDLPNDKPTHISLRYLFGIGPTLALEICEKTGVDPQRRARELSDDEIGRIAVTLDKDYTVEGPLRRQLHQNVQRLKEI